MVLLERNQVTWEDYPAIRNTESDDIGNGWDSPHDLLHAVYARLLGTLH